MPDHQKGRDVAAENSPGFRCIVQATEQLTALAGRSLDVGCGAGFVLQYLNDQSFHLHPFGVDVSEIAVAKARMRLGSDFPNVEKRIVQAEAKSLPFDSDYFSLVTSFDVLDHVKESDIIGSLREIGRVVRPGGMFLGSVSCSRSAVAGDDGDDQGNNLRSLDWWIEKMNPDKAVYDGSRKQLLIWKRRPFGEDQPLFQFGEAEGRAMEEVAGHPADSKELYQQIYDGNPWYGDAGEGRCPGVRLMPKYQDWLIGPVIDLGCGRGHTVERLREIGFEAEGIDQITKHPGMMVGDITKPIDKILRFKSAVCVDCIEHLYDDQVEGLFANMKQVQRQAFSIHNGESTGTGQELHVNRRHFDQWRAIIEKHFAIEKEIALHDKQMLYLTRSKTT